MRLVGDHLGAESALVACGVGHLVGLASSVLKSSHFNGLPKYPKEGARARERGSPGGNAGKKQKKPLSDFNSAYNKALLILIFDIGFVLDIESEAGTGTRP